MAPVRLELAAPPSRVKQSTTEPLRSLECVVQMKDTKHIRQDFHSFTLVMPQGWDFGALGVPRGVKKIKHGHVVYQIDGDDEQNKMQVKVLS